MSIDYVRKIDDTSIVDTFTEEYTGEQTNVDIITPSSGKRIEVHSILLHGSAGSGAVSLDFATSGIPVARLYLTKSGEIYASRVKIQGAVDEPLTLNISGVQASDTTFVAVNYKQV